MEIRQIENNNIFPITKIYNLKSVVGNTDLEKLFFGRNRLRARCPR